MLDLATNTLRLCLARGLELQRRLDRAEAEIRRLRALLRDR
jgi:hypothetical protein